MSLRQLRLGPAPWGSTPRRYGPELRGRAVATLVPLRGLVPQSRSSKCLDFGGFIEASRAAHPLPRASYP